MEIAVHLHNVRSAYNVGSVFRTADAAGVKKIFLSGYTPTPIDRFGRPLQMIAKVALGAEKSVPWEYEKNAYRVVHKARSEGWQIVGVEQDAKAVDYKRFKPKNKVLFMFGNEVRGISKALREKCEVLIEIPMRGKKESLNVSVAAGIILFNY